MSDEWTTLYHVGGCGGPACKVLQSSLVRGGLIKSENFRHLDDSPMIRYSIPRCDSCGQVMAPGWLKPK